MRKTTINTAIKRFCTAWQTGVEKRYQAACIYADAVNEWSLDAKSQFHQLEEFANWTPQQWRLLYYIGSGAIAACFLDFSRPTIPLALRRRGVTVEEQEAIFENGIHIVDINGKAHVIKLRYMQEKHISQVWDENGRKRTVFQQLKWLQDHQTSNFEVMSDGTIRVNHKCYITPAVLAKLLTTKPYPLSSAELAAVARSVRR